MPAFWCQRREFFAARSKFSNELVRSAQTGYRLLQVDNVDSVAGGEDVRLHLRIPTIGGMAEVCTRFQQLTNRNNARQCLCHTWFAPFLAKTPPPIVSHSLGRCTPEERLCLWVCVFWHSIMPTGSIAQGAQAASAPLIDEAGCDLP